jgi:hypothetical protein
MNVLKLGMNINKMIWIENQQFLLGSTNNGSLLVISLVNNAPRIKESFEIKKNLNIFSMQFSITDANEILLSTDKGIFIVNYTYKKLG